MCSICGQMPCHPRCPGATEPSAAAYCRRCGTPLFAGDKHYDGICETCLDDMDTSEWLKLFGTNMEEIEEEDSWQI